MRRFTGTEADGVSRCDVVLLLVPEVEQLRARRGGRCLACDVANAWAAPSANKEALALGNLDLRF